MKKILSVLLTLAIVFCALPLSAFTASAQTSGNYTYTVSGGKATITDCDDDISGKITIPSKLGGYPVTAIGDFAFSECDKLTGVLIPNTVTSIGDEAFDDCRKLAAISIPDSVTYMGYDVFGDTAYYNKSSNWVDNVLYINNHLIKAKEAIVDCHTVKDGTKTIAGGAFEYCEKLTAVEIPDSVKSIGFMAFCDCVSLESLYIPDDTIYIGMSAFDNTAFYNNQNNWENGALYIDNHLIEVNYEKTGSFKVKNGTKTVADSAFLTCMNLTKIELPNSLVGIGEGAFGGCTGLTSITIPQNVIRIGDGAFVGCSNLIKIAVNSNNRAYKAKGNCLIDTKTKTLISGCGGSVIPTDGSVKKIGALSFSAVENLKSITIPNSVVSIDDMAFMACIGLEKITIGKGLKNIGDGAFSLCTNLKSITVSSDNATYKSQGNCLIETKSKKLIVGCQNSIIPSDNSVKIIGEGAFAGLTMSEVVIPDGVTKIEDMAFALCTIENAIVVPKSVTEIGEGAFSGLFDSLNISIDKDSYAYKYAIENEIPYVFTDPCSIGHTVDYIPLVAAQIGKAGTKAHYKCVLCNQLFVDGEVVTAESLVIKGLDGWQSNAFGWWYQYGDGGYAIGWEHIDNQWYYFDSNGWMQTGWVLDGSTWYYMYASGEMATGWLLDGNSWYYLDSTGAMQTGWVLDGGSWYYLDSTGAMQTGWVLDGSNWYYLESTGVMQTGWIFDGSDWYYMNENGTMATGWAHDGSNWYYMQQSGAMATNWVLDGSIWYLLEANGAWSGYSELA